MNTWDKQKANDMYKIKLQKVKSTMKKCKITLNPLVVTNGAIIARKNQNIIKKKNQEPINFMKLYKQKDYSETEYKRGHEAQTVLKRLLREFGLQQYLRVNKQLI
jgi:hypothetical protein